MPRHVLGLRYVMASLASSAVEQGNRSITAHGVFPRRDWLKVLKTAARRVLAEMVEVPPVRYGTAGQ